MHLIRAKIYGKCFYLAKVTATKDKFCENKEKLSSILTVIMAIAVIILVLSNAPDLRVKAVIPVPSETPTTTEQGTVPVEETQGGSGNEVTQITQPPTTTPENEDIGKSANQYILVKGTSAMEMYDINRPKLEGYSDIINRFAAKVPQVKTFVMLAPTSIEFYGPESYRTGLKSQREGIKIAYDRLNNSITPVDVWSELSQKTNDYIYFRTDHHWTAKGAYCGYKALSKVAGFTPTPLESYRVDIVEDFVGSMYRYTQNDIIKNNPDYVEYFYSSTMADAMVFEDVFMTEGKSIRLIYNEIKDDNKYMVFVQGDHPLVKIRTETKNGQKIAVIKESYGNALIPFLIDNFEEIYVIDPRKIDMKLDVFVKGEGINNILFINYMQAPTNNVYIESLTNLVDG